MKKAETSTERGKITMKTEVETSINIGIAKKDRREIADGLSHVLADTYALYLKTQNFHWNVTGPMFQTLHLMFETQYKALAEAIDEIAERIRALGFSVPANFSSFSRLASIKEDKEILSAEEMIRSLLEGHQTIVHTLNSVVPNAERAHDLPSVDLVTERMQYHEKTAWMLRSLLS